MIKLSKNIKKYALFILVCFLPLFISAASLGTLTPGAVKTQTHAWWDVFDCTTNKTGPFTVEVVSTPYYYKKSYYRSVKITVDDYVPETISNITTTCTYYDVDQGDSTLNSGRLFGNRTVTYTFNISAGGTITTTTNDKTYYLYKTQSINLTDKLGISKIESFSYESGSQHGTLGYTGCAVGSSACSITFNSGSAVQNRDHVFIVKYVNTAGKTYETTVLVYEQANTRTDDLGYIDPGDYTYSIFDENTSNFTCSKVSSGPYDVEADIDGTSGRIKITSTNYSLSSYTDLKAQCTYTKSGIAHTTTYNFGLAPSDAVENNKEYTANGGETFNIWSDLKIKKIISSTVEFTSNGKTTGCYSGNTSCSLKMNSSITDGRTTTAVIIYYDTSNVLTQSTVTVHEQLYSVENNLGTIGVNKTESGNIPASGVTCSTSSTGPFTHKVVAKGNGYVLSVTNNNKTVNTYDNQLITCTGTPNGVGGKTYKYNFKFNLSNETTPIKLTRSYELFQDESLDFASLFPLKRMYKAIEYKSGSSAGVMSITGCTVDSSSCKVTLVGPNVQHNREHKMVVSYVNGEDVLYELTVTIIEKDKNLTTKAYPGLLGFCDFSDQWEYATWADSSGKNYSFYEAQVRGATLPKCSANADSGIPLTFKGWTKGYKAGDALTTKSTCGNDLLQPGQATSYGQTYAPCYEMEPHIRLLIDSGTLVNNGSFEFKPDDMTYIARGSSFNQEVVLPDVEYKGFNSTTKLQIWKNNSTGETKKPGEKVKLDGSVWVAVSSRTVAQLDLYKSIGLDEVRVLSVSGMDYCSTSSSYVSASYKSGDCTIKGLAITPYDVYGDVTATMSDGTTRVYRFIVEDRSSINVDDNGIFNVDTDENIVIGKNDDSTLNEFNTDQCENFFISRSGDKKGVYDAYVKYTFAYSKSKPTEAMNTGIYSVYQLCPTDQSTYVALCLDPGRRGPNESGTGTHTKEIQVKGKTVTVYGNEYTKTSDIQKNSEFGKLVMYIVKNLGISDFNTNNASASKRRAAAHVAVRTMAIVDEHDMGPDPADTAYLSHYYPYMGVATVISAALADGDVSEAEARNAVENGDGTNGFTNWQNGVDELVVDIFANYGGSDTTGATDGFQRTIDDSVYEPTADGKGYTINYTGTITAPTGATANLVGSPGTSDWCRNDSAYGVNCKKNEFKLLSTENGRNTYQYNFTIEVPDASAIKPPSTVEEEKDLSFQLEYSGGFDLINAFIASPANGSDNVQRMLIISTSNPKVYIYFSVVPNTCDLPVLKQENCPDTEVDASGNVIRNKCKENIDNKTFNSELFKAAGCCRYVFDEDSYLYKRVCSAECTSSTLSTVCNYTTAGKEKADFYEINEGSKFVNTNAKPDNAIGTCIVNVNELYKNDGGSSLSVIDPSKNFTKYDDGDNLINVDAYNDNRYCQVTCEEDWEFSMDSFGNFIGEDAVAAGTYFQIVSNDMFMGAKRTCYTTFINYDRFMQNIVELSNQVVDAYNDYSEWSHVWTDIDKQIEPGYDAAGDYTYTTDAIKCVEYFDKCPQGTALGDYYWSDEVNNCRMVPNYGQTENATCVSLDSNTNSMSTYGYRNGDADYDNSGANNDTTKCVFNRYHCDGHGYSKIWSGSISGSGESYTCSYRLYISRTTSEKEPGSSRYTLSSLSPGDDGTCSKWSSFTQLSGGRCYLPGKSTCTGAGYDGTDENGKCYYLVCPSDTTPYDGKCYDPCSDSTYDAGSNSETPYCFKNVTKTAKVANLSVDVSYNNETLKCRTWGKSYDYTLKTENDIEVTNKDGKDIYYGTEEYDPMDLADNTVGGAKDNTQNKPVDGNNVKGNYAKTYTHSCSITAATYYPGSKGSSECHQTNLTGADAYGKTNDMFCADGKYAVLSDGSLDKAFCYAGGGKTYTDTTADASTDSGDYSNEEDAFEWITEKFKDHAKKKLDSARSTMTSLQSRIYSHAQDIFDCQNFQLHNRTDDSDAKRAKNTIPSDTIMGMSRSYVKINTDFDPTAAYTYDESFFMERLDKDNVLIQYTEKNDALFGGTDKYALSTNKQVDATIQTPSGPVNTKLSRNYIETYYYNPTTPWCYGGCDTNDADDRAEKAKLDNYEDSTVTSSPLKASKKVVLCYVGVESKGIGYAPGKDGSVIPFSATASTPEWLGGRCFEVTVDYKQVHYVKSSISNSSYYKNKGNWYVRGGDSKIHGDDISSAISKFNRIQPSGYVEDYEDNSEEHKRWSRLGSFNVFPVSMATPRNLYQYTYTFGNIGSYYDGKLGRIMGTQKSIIQNNTRTCFYEVYEEVCLCCGYQIPPGDVVISSGIGDNFGYEGSDVSLAGGNTSGTISFYTNTVALGDIGLGRDGVTLGDNWSDDSLFMYNGDDSLSTDKGYKLKENIEYTGENVYADEPEYAYFLNPDTLKQIRSYNDINGYDLDLEKLIVYEVDNIACNGSSCEKGDSETINFQHYGSKFLVGQVQGINLTNYGSIKNTNTKVCVIEENLYNSKYDMSQKMEKEGCRWVDYIEKSNSYYNPTTKTSSNTWFRLAFK